MQTWGAHASENWPVGWFHGTKARLRSNDVLLPLAQNGGAPTTAPMVPGVKRPEEADEFVHITPRYGFAWAYAYRSGGDGPPAVLRVQPEGAVGPDPEHASYEAAYRCASAVVVEVYFDPPFSYEDAEQGWEQPLPETFIVVKTGGSTKP